MNTNCVIYTLHRTLLKVQPVRISDRLNLHFYEIRFLGKIFNSSLPTVFGNFTTRTFIVNLLCSLKQFTYRANTYQNPIIISAAASKNPQLGIIN